MLSEQAAQPRNHSPVREEQSGAAYRLFVITGFIGLLLTFFIIYTINLSVGKSQNLAPTCYDGSVIEGSDVADEFNRAFYHNITTLSLVREGEYRIFGAVNHQNVLAGRDGFLFEVEDVENNYHYIEDFNGRLSFTEEEHAAILQELTARRASLAARGAEYLLVILPNAQSVYSEKMPPFVGTHSEENRLSRLEQYLVENEFYSFQNLTDSLRQHKHIAPLYNNTENSLNALGFYYTYCAVYERFSPSVKQNTSLIERSTLSFYQHQTKGKRVAQLAGLEEVAHNHTVSLSNNTKLNYRFVFDTGDVAETFLLPFDYAVDVARSPSLLLQVPGRWERTQIEPFFSNTFSNVTYQIGLSDDQKIFDDAAPRVVIQFVYENQLSQLLPEPRSAQND